MPRIWLLTLICFLAIACTMGRKDIVMPQFEYVDVMSESHIRLVFDRPVTIISASLDQEDISIDMNSDGTLHFSQPLHPGRRYELEGVGSDNDKNTIHFKTIFYGFNPNPTEVLINEFTTKHSKTQKERVELYVTKAGSLAGLTLFLGQPHLSGTRSVILPDYQVYKGQLITLQLRPPSEGHTAKNYDLLVNIDPPGLPNVRGMILIANSPDARKILDAIVYLDGVNETPATFLRQVDWLREQKLWVGDPIQICGTTPTRSVLRKSKTDSHSAQDWYVVQTKMLNFSQDRQPPAYPQDCKTNY